MYKLKNDFKQYNDSIYVYMQELIKNCTKKFQTQVKAGEIIDKVNDSMGLARLVYYLEDYLYYVFQNSPADFNHVFNSIMNGVRTIAVLPYDYRWKIYGRTEEDEKTIYVNPDLKGSTSLTGEERQKLYVAHELGHIVNGKWMDKALSYVYRLRIPMEKADLIYQGFSMLDEAISQNRAENFAYDSSRKHRPKLGYYRAERMFGGEKYKTNFDYYGELQEPAVMFARTLRGLGKINNDEKVLDLLSERAMNPDFFDSIIKEYKKDGHAKDLLFVLTYMGLIKKASYANFGQDDINYLLNSRSYLEKLIETTEELRDYREPVKD